MRRDSALSRKRDLRFPPLISREKDGGLPPGTAEKAASPSKLWREALGNNLSRVDPILIITNSPRDSALTSYAGMIYSRINN